MSPPGPIGGGGGGAGNVVVDKHKLEKLARKMADGGSPDTAQLKVDIRELMTEFKASHTDDARMEWLEAEYPTIYAFLDQHKQLIEGGPSQALDGVVDAAAGKIREAFAKTSWDEVGLSIRYESEAAHLCKLGETCQALKPLPDKSGRTTLRFAVEADKLEPLVPDAGFAESWESATKKRLQKLGVKDVDVQTIGRAGLFRAGDRVIHMPPKDGALLIDNAVLGERGYSLVKNAAMQLVYRGHDDGNKFAMPISAFLGMRGIAFELPDNNDDTVLGRVMERLQQRGAKADALLKDAHGGERVIELTTDDARLLLAPVAEGDPATKLTTRKIAHVPEAQGYHCENAVLTVQASDLTYKSKSDIEKFAKLWGFDDVTHVEHGPTDAQGFIAFDKEKNAIMVAIRGTESRRDIAIDADMRGVDGARFGGGTVPTGFASQADGLMPQIEAAIRKYATDPNNPPSVMFTGHSLGGAVACLSAGAIGVKLRDDPTMPRVKLQSAYTYGQPRTGDGTWVKGLESLLASHGAGYFRFVNNNDHVTRVPPGYEHGGVLMYIDGRGALHPPKTDGSGHDRSGLLGALSDGVDDHRSHFYIALVRKARDVVVEIRERLSTD